MKRISQAIVENDPTDGTIHTITAVNMGQHGFGILAIEISTNPSHAHSPSPSRPHAKTHAWAFHCSKSPFPCHPALSPRENDVRNGYEITSIRKSRSYYYSNDS